MTFLQYKSLSPYMQLEILGEKGVMIAKRVSTTCMYLLYQIDSFYVEIKSSLFESRIKGIKCFFETKYLEPYLLEISLPDLL